METGPSEGVGATSSGVAMVTIDGVGSLFAIDIDDFDIALAAALVKNTGPADAVGFATFRPGDVNGRWTGRGRVRGDARPMPLYLERATGAMRVAQAKATDGDGNTAAINYYDYTAVFSNIALAHAPTDKGGEDVWTVEFTVAISGRPTPAWNNYDGTAEGTLTPAPSTSWKEIWSGRGKSVDPAAAKIDHSATSVYDVVYCGTANADEVTVAGSITTGAAAPQTGLKVARVGFTRIDGIGSQAVLTWELDNSNDRVVNGGQHSAIDLISAHTYTSVTLLDTASTPETVLAAYLAAFQAEPHARRMRVQKLNNKTAAIVKEYEDPGISVISHTEGLPDYQLARVSGGNVQVFVRQVLQRGTGKYKLLLGRSYKRRVARRFKVRRYLSGTTIPDQPSLVNTTNNATFLGLSAGNAMYLSCDVVTNIGLATPYQFAMDYEFEWFSGGFYDLDGWNWEIETSASVSAGWVNVSSLTGSGLASAIPSQSDFSVFLA